MSTPPADLIIEAGTHPPMGQPYSPEADELLRLWAAKGYTARHVGNLLERTRNSVLGRAHRLGIHFAARNGGGKFRPSRGS